MMSTQVCTVAKGVSPEVSSFDEEEMNDISRMPPDIYGRRRRTLFREYFYQAIRSRASKLVVDNGVCRGS